jgi:hypothetical protein
MTCHPANAQSRAAPFVGGAARILPIRAFTHTTSAE